MGKVIAVGGGIFFDQDSGPFVEEIMNLVEKKDDMKMVFIPTAAHDSHDEEEIVKDFCTKLGFAETTSLYLTDESLTEEYIRDTILSASFIYVDGGNLKFLMDTWKKTKADIYLKQAYEKGIVLAGHSSGAMCWFKRGYDDCGIDHRYMFVDCLDLFPYIYCPHFEDWPTFREDVKMQELDGLGVDNFTAISIVDGEYKIIKADRDPRNTAYLLPADEGYELKDLAEEHLPLKGINA